MEKVDRRAYIAFGRIHIHTARAIFRELLSNDFFPFINDPLIYPNYNQEFIHSQITTRAHFIVLISSSLLDHNNHVGSLANEIEFALDQKRNIIVMSLGGHCINKDQLSKLIPEDELSSSDPIIISSQSLETSIKSLTTRLSQHISNPIYPTMKKFKAELSERLIRENLVIQEPYDLLLAEHIYEEAYHHQILGEYDEALAVYQRVCDLNPNFDIAYQTRGILKIQQENYHSAKIDLTSSITLYPYDPISYHYRGIAQFLTQSYDLAISDFSQAISLNPNWSEPYIGRAIVAFHLDNHGSALDNIQKALSIQPDSAYALILRGDIRKSSGEIKDAIADYTQAIALLPDNAAAFISRSQAWLATENYDGALADICQATLLDPSPAYFIDLGNLLKSMEDLDGAIQLYSLALEIDPYQTDALLGRASVHQINGDRDSALVDYSAAIKIEPLLFEAYMNRGNILHELQSYQEAITDYTKALEIDAASAQAYLQRGLSRYCTGKLYLAIIDFSSAIDQSSLENQDHLSLSRAYCQRATAFLELGELGRAKQDFQNALKITHHDRFALIGMTLTLFDLGDKQQAKSYFSQLAHLENHQTDIVRKVHEYSIPHELMFKFNKTVQYLE